jgi:hypothetical protein
MAAYGETGTTQSAGSGLLIIERILRDRESIWRQIGEERDLGKLTRQMLYSSVVALACYGAVLGASHSVAQSALSAVKLPLLFLMTLAICLPTLYLFNLVFGARLQVRQALALVMVTITVMSVLALAFAPISLFFLITAFSYSFYKILNVAILTLTAFIGLRFLTGGMKTLNAHTTAIAAAKRRQHEDQQRAAAAAEAAAVAALSTPSDNAPVSPAPAGAATTTAAEPEPGDPATLPALVSAVPGLTAPVQTPNGPAPATQAQVATLPVARTPQPVQPTQPQLQPALAGAPLLMPDGHYAYPMAAQPQLAPRPVAQQQLPLGERPASMTLLNVWILLFGFVGTQLAWTLRPFVGEPHEPFEIFRKIEGNFYVNIIHAIADLF